MAAADCLRDRLAGTRAEIVLGLAEQSGLPGACATVVYGEAMLSMQSQEQKNRIAAKPGGFLLPEDGTESTNCATRLTIFQTI